MSERVGPLCVTGLHYKFSTSLLPREIEDLIAMSLVMSGIMLMYYYISKIVQHLTHMIRLHSFIHYLWILIIKQALQTNVPMTNPTGCFI